MKTTIITLPIPRFEWKLLPAITKTGRISKTRTEFRRIKIADEQEFQGFEFNYKGKIVEVFVPVANMDDEHHTASWCCDKDGKEIKAIWQHGQYGSKTHEEAALFDWKRQYMVDCTVYCDGRFKDSYKYLRKVCF